MTNRYYQMCECQCDEHLLAFYWDDEYERMYVHYFLVEKPWHERLWLGIKYIFGYKTVFGHFGEVIWNQQNVADLVDVLCAFQNKSKPTRDSE